MKSIIPLFLLFFLAACSTSQIAKKTTPEIQAAKENSIKDFKIIPLPKSITPTEGQFSLNSSTRIFAEKGLTKEADFLQSYLQLQTGLNLSVAANKASKNQIVLSLDSGISGEEAYTLAINPNEIEIKASTAKGIFYGIQTLRQFFTDGLNAPAGKIVDEPRFVYRGMHLDVGRHFYPVSFIKKYIDILALHKMNNFHWHLTEDQGWRLEIKKYPKLTEIGAYRAETAVEKNFPHSGTNQEYKGDGKRYGGFYTQEEAKEIVRYAAERHINVIPEIEMPGHATAALASYPELGNNTGPYEVIKWWGVFDQIYAPKEETFKFLEDVLLEVFEIFPSEYIHIGGDEAPKKEWKNSAQAQAVIKREGLKDEHELQSYFIQRMEKFINAHGRKIIGWDEILEGGLAPNATVMSWRGTQGGIHAAKENHDVIMTPTDFLYFDYYQDKKDAETKTPFGIGGLVTPEKTYSFNPMPEELSADKQKHILGAQGNIWTEYIKDGNHVEYMLLPRLGALSEVDWTPNELKNYKDWKNRMQNLKFIYDKMDLNYAPYIFE
ncbi:Beta-hexosaminidase [Candidatus Ornithobacterium hominis]|uniref:beta-N-acetylhexosaminidase n=1 Tax=Candidatus Ornithobacterium hominis TaxID=2497989 RepID=A0A383TYI3_9FLAO|nr:beta-N-acetylhexosaminidase [Candidatus Ornithobacterium hominis]MCT7904171.1 beta-N-acetylhexosaminidase [Candidatus Ornithobacterium hominis]SZD72288.1 Beta-hexosaminidase [Candidatus Ornithobacterium hominis]SZD72567.1 Beta-hexosaminidase [Candidatus Ornithobacterium hominis]